MVRRPERSSGSQSGDGPGQDGEQGNLSNAKGVGVGAFECRINFGPGYRVYFGKDGDKLVILLGSGTKKRQQKDVEHAHSLWRSYKRRKREN